MKGLPRHAIVVALMLIGLGACERSPAGAIPSDGLDQAISNAIGDPNTCVLIADRASGKILYRYGEYLTCGRTLPACDRQGGLTTQGALALARAPGGRATSCRSSADGSRTVGWAQGTAMSAKGQYIYSASMEGQRALPGQEMSARLDQAFSDAGL